MEWNAAEMKKTGHILGDIFGLESEYKTNFVC
jgi:hypothetical protein